MPTLTKLLENNRDWAKQSTRVDPDFFERLTERQSPEYLWIGCSDSRVPANQILNLLPGEVFVHRNIANLVKDDDDNCLSVLQYALEVLKVKHIIVTGHYGCGGVDAAMGGAQLDGRLAAWLRSIQDLRDRHLDQLDPANKKATFDRLCELNVLDQTTRLSQTTVMKAAWARDQAVEIHSWIYRLEDGIISPLRDVIREPVKLGD